MDPRHFKFSSQSSLLLNVSSLSENTRYKCPSMKTNDQGRSFMSSTHKPVFALLKAMVNDLMHVSFSTNPIHKTKGSPL